MKKIILFILGFTPALSLAIESDLEKSIETKLNAQAIRKIILPKKIGGKIFTPYAVWFVQKNDFAPTCTLIDKDNLNHVLEMAAPSDGQFENCHQALEEPVINFIRGSYYATYTYVIEETRADFRKEYQVIKLKKDGFSQCKEDQLIADAIQKEITKKMKLKSAVQKIIEKIGCTDN